VPVTRVRHDELHRDVARGRIGRRAAEVDARSAGLPVGVQIAGRPWHESQVLAAMIAVEDGVVDDEGLPSTPVEP
jgi:fatty acid amide hydrolase